MKDYKKAIENINYCISALSQSKKSEDLKTMKTYIDFNFRHDFNELPELLYIYKYRETSDDHEEEIEILVNTLSEIEDLLKIIISTGGIDHEIITIKGKLIDLFKKSESFNIKNIDEDAYNIWEYEIKKFLDEFNFKIDFKSDFERLKRKEYKGILASKEEISVPHLEDRIYHQRALILRIIKNLIKQGEDFIVSSTTDYSKPFESYQDTAEVCLNGHIINPNIIKNPTPRKKRCGICGKETITKCPICGDPIPGRIIYKDFRDNTVWGPPSNYCNNCGNPYPWAKQEAETFLEHAGEEEYDAFLSHADEDKITLADKLCKRLTEDGFKIWYDRKIKPDQSIPSEVNEGISKSRNGIVIFSNYYKKSRWCTEELNALKNKSIDRRDFKLFIILHNFNLDIFKKDYPSYSHKRILFSRKGIDYLLGEIEPQLKLKNKSIEEKPEENKGEEEYINIHSDEIIDYKSYDPEKNHSKYIHSKKIILENLKDIPLTITRIIINTDFPIVENHFNSQAEIKLNNILYKFNPSGDLEIPLNQNPLVISPKADINLVLSLYTSTKVQYTKEYDFKYIINMNESPNRVDGCFKIKTKEIK